MGLWSYDDEAAKELLASSRSERPSGGEPAGYARRSGEAGRGPNDADQSARRASATVRVLGVLAGILALAIITGSIYAFASGSRDKMLQREADKAQTAGTAFTGIGTVRAKSADSKDPAVVVATIAFPYDAGDKSFAEELGRKAPVLRAAALSVLSSKKAAELAPAFEGTVKAALRDAFNDRLSLGKVTEIWLSDFAVIK
jgi:flagellar basal body-associated protein FliL